MVAEVRPAVFATDEGVVEFLPGKPDSGKLRYEL